MKPEQLKVIAEGMGYKPVDHPSPSRQGDVQMYEKGEFYPMTQYNPLTNNGQMVEIVEKLKLDICYDHDSGGWEAYYNNNDECMRGKIINEAACKAAYEYFSGGKS